MAEVVYLGLGSNLGDRAANIGAALDSLAALPGTALTAVSSLYETRPVGGPAGQGEYLNSAARIETELTPAELLAEANRIEREMGRVRDGSAERWGPRIIDIDILFYGTLSLDGPSLVVPHPRLTERAFVLAPLAEIAGDFRHPAIGSAIGQLAQEMDWENEGIRRLSF